MIGDNVATLGVNLGDRSYPIQIGSGILSRAGALLRDLKLERVVLVTNATVAGHWLAPIARGFADAGITADTIMIPDGEAHKNQRTLDDVLTQLLEMRAERTTAVVALGGGVVGDVAGFAAAVYQRGIPFVQIPTTLLAQVDSSVGGKTGINHPLGKNMIGAFYQPRLVLVDTDCLRTLPPRELAAGMAEVVKYGAIHDVAFFDWLESNAELLAAADSRALRYAIHTSCAVKAAIVEADEREGGVRALLNFGHTFGHAIEAHAGYGAWLHGEAVGAGMVLAAKLSARVRGLPVWDVDRLVALLRRLNVPTEAPVFSLPRWLDLMGRDKKVAAGRIRFVLLDALGRAVVTDAVSKSDLAAVLP
ncbi:MAG: 3-dehydroquinate synthase [Vicinamibacterales bacterium]